MRYVLIAMILTCLCTATFADDTIRIVESFPLETDLDLPQIPQASDVWVEMINQAQETIAIESFYFSDDPQDDNDALDQVLNALHEAAMRGVRIRAIGDEGFYETYPDILDMFNTWPNTEARLIPAHDVWGGVQHAKFMIVDAHDVYIGSQNWDWRALSHIHEVGAQISHKGLAYSALSIFDWDWSLAGEEEPQLFLSSRSGYWQIDQTEGILAASPPNGLPINVPYDEPLLVDLMDRAEKSLRLHLLSYNPGDRDGGYYSTLDGALRRAAARGVRVEIILSNWAKRSYMLPHIKSLAVLENIEVRFTNIPEHSSGFIPFARVEHPKYLIRDDAEVWLGTSNWARSYFHTSRNLSLFLKGGQPVIDLNSFFKLSWESQYAEIVDPGADYQPPRRKE